MYVDGIDYPERYKSLTSPDALRLAEYYLIQGDLKAAKQTLSLYTEKFPFTDELNSEERTISASLFRDSILLFCSCFSKRDPNKLVPKDVFGHLDDWEAFYARVLDTRDAFVAHNFGPYRQNNIVIVCVEIGKQLVPAALTQFHVRFSGWVGADTNKLLHFIDEAMRHLETKIEAAEQPLLQMLEKIPAEALEALPESDIALPGSSDIRSSRDRFRQSGRGERLPLPQRHFSKVRLASVPEPVADPDDVAGDDAPPE